VLDRRITCDECWIESEGLPAKSAGLRRGLAGLTMDRSSCSNSTPSAAGASAASAFPFLLRRAATAEDRARLTRRRTSPDGSRRRSPGGRLQESALDSVAATSSSTSTTPTAAPSGRRPISSRRFGRHLARLSGSSMSGSLEGRAAGDLDPLGAASRGSRWRRCSRSFRRRTRYAAHRGLRRRGADAGGTRSSTIRAASLSIDPSANILQQMDRLTDAEVRDLARRLVPTL